MDNVIIIVSVLAVWWVWDVIAWRRRSVPELRRRAHPHSLATVQRALKELRRRGEPIQPLLTLYASELVADTAMRRMASLQIIRKFFPREAALLTGYSAVADPAACQKAAAPLLASVAASTAQPFGAGQCEIDQKDQPYPSGMTVTGYLLLFAAYFMYWQGPAFLDKNWHVMLSVVCLHAAGVVVGLCQLAVPGPSSRWKRLSPSKNTLILHAAMLLVFVGVPLWRMWRSS